MNEKSIWDFLLEKINNPYGVAALMGNLYVESHLNPMLLQSSYARKIWMTDEEYTQAVDNGSYSRDNFINDKAGYGLVQWTYWSRKEALYDYAKSVSASIGDLVMQLNRMWDELQSYKTVLNALYTATNIREASDVVAKTYEKPEHQEEEYLENRAKFGQAYYDQFAEVNAVANTWSQVSSMLSGWKSQGLKKPEIVVNLANACIGWNYIFGDRGEECNPSHVKGKVSALDKDHHADAESLKKRCQCALYGGTDCNGCKFYPGGRTLAYDCRGFTYWCFLKGAGITINGAGCTSQWNNNANWAEKGAIANMPKDKVCCVFRYDSSTGKYEHTLIYDGQGNYIHCSGEVKKCETSKYKATHYAIPKGLYSGGGGGGGKTVVAQATVYNGAPGTSTVNMRSSKNSSGNSNIIAQVPIGTVVDVYENGSDWCEIGYDGKDGYMMTKFLNFNASPTPTPTPSGDTVTVNKSDLETIYSMVGSMLGK